MLVVGGTVEAFEEVINPCKLQGKTIGVMAQDVIVESLKNTVNGVYYMGESVDDMNRALFDGLRTLDHLGLDIILAQEAPETGVGIAYMNRLKKAASTVL